MKLKQENGNAGHLSGLEGGPVTLGVSNSKWSLKLSDGGAAGEAGQRSHYKGAEVLGTGPFEGRLMTALLCRNP